LRPFKDFLENSHLLTTNSMQVQDYIFSF
jgi:hypothetical protein